MKANGADLNTILAELRQLRKETKIAGGFMLPIEETATFLGIAPRTIRNELQKGVFPVKPRRRGGKLLWLKSDLEQYCNSLPEYSPRERKARKGPAE